MNPRSRASVVVTAALFLLAAAAGAAEPEPETIRAGVFVSPPFVLDPIDGKYEGMAIDLWRKVAERMGVKSTAYKEYPTIHAFLYAVQSGEVDVALTDLTVTHERTKYLKFTFPWYESGLRIMVRAQSSGSVWDELKRSGHVRSYACLALFILALTVAMTLIRRRKEDDFPGGWVDGLAKSLYDLTYAATHGEIQTNFFGWLGNIMAAVWLICGIGFVAYVTSTVTSAMTTTAISDSGIRSVNDLPGKRVAVLKDSVAEGYAKRSKARYTACVDLDEAVAALLAKDVDAIVADAPELEYRAHIRPKEKLAVVGNIFHPDKYAFAANLAHGDLVDRITVELIHLHELKVIEELKDKYFGAEWY